MFSEFKFVNPNRNLEYSWLRSESLGILNCKSEYYTGGYCINPYYESNKAILLSAFGSSNCDSEYDEGNYKYLYCSVSGLSASAYSDGYVDAYDDDWSCIVRDDGSSYCGGR